MDKATPLQKQALRFFRIRHEEDITTKQASELLEVAFGNADSQTTLAWSIYKSDNALATGSQVEKLRFFNVKFTDATMQSEAQAVIDKIFANPQYRRRWNDSRPATSQQREVLTFFKVKIPPDLTYGKAREMKESLLKDRDRKAQWNAHKKNPPATVEQKERLQVFGRKIPKDLKTQEAQQLVDELMQDAGNAAKWAAHGKEMQRQEEEEARKEEQAEWEEMYLYDLNDECADSDCKKISKNRFKSILAQLSGHSNDYLEMNTDVFFDKALEMYPELQRKSAASAPSYSDSTAQSYSEAGDFSLSTRTTRRPQKAGCSVVLVCLLGVLGAMAAITLAG